MNDYEKAGFTEKEAEFLREHGVSAEIAQALAIQVRPLDLPKPTLRQRFADVIEQFIWHIEFCWSRIKPMLQQRCKPSTNDRYLSRLERWFYTFKAIICVLLGRELQTMFIYSEDVSVAFTSGGTSYPPGEPTIHWYEEIRVGGGIFKHWHYYEDSHSN